MFAKGFCAYILIGFTALMSGCAGNFPPSKPIAHVVDASKTGTPASDIIGELRGQRTTYALRGSDFGKLRKAGVPDGVLDYIQSTFYSDVDLLVRYWINGESLGPCGPCYPQQVNIEGVETGTIPTTFPPPLRTTFGRALGLPNWYRPLAASFSRPAITIEEVRQMVKTGVPESQVVSALKAGRLVNVIGVGGFGSFGTRIATGLSGTRLADLRDEGVSDAVLDELQASYLAVYVEASRFRYMDMGKGSRS